MGKRLCLSVFVAVFICSCEAKKEVSESESLSRKYIKHKWMEKLEDSRLLSSVSIPGTQQSSKHLTISKPRFQVWVLQNQLDAGVRFFELHVSSGSIKYGGPGGVEEPETLSYVLKTLQTFLLKQDSETVLLRLFPDEDAVAQVTKKISKDDIWTSQEIPTLGQARGKIVLIQSSTFKLGLPVHVTELDGEMDGKETLMKENIKLASEKCDNGMALSYAGAKEDSEDPLEMAKMLNKPLDEYLLNLKGSNKRPHCVGIIALDFPGPKIIETIINFNGKLGLEGAKEDVVLPDSEPKSVTGRSEEPKPDHVTHGPGEPKPDDVTHGPGEPKPDGVTHGPGEPKPDDVTHGPGEPKPDDVTHGPGEPKPDDVTHGPGEPKPDDITNAPGQPKPDDVTHGPGEPKPDDVTHRPGEPKPDDVTNAPGEPKPGDVTDAPGVPKPGDVTDAHGEPKPDNKVTPTKDQKRKNRRIIKIKCRKVHAHKRPSPLLTD